MSKAIRDAYGESLLKYGKENSSVVVLDADVSSSTKSCLFGQSCPERFFNVGIAEANMVGMAAGLSATGKIAFVNTFAVFLSSIGLISARAFASYSNMNIKFMGGYGGVSDSFDGPSHHALEDIAIMRALPNFKVFVAADEFQTDWLIKNAIDTDGPVYVRLSRDAAPPLYSPDTTFKTGKGNIVQEGIDATVIACGVMVSKALMAAELLEKENIQIRVVDMYCIKPLDRDLLLESASKTGAVITAEEHSIIGGLGSAVAEVLSSENAKIPQSFIGTKDCHTESGPYLKLLEKYGMDETAIYKAVKEIIKRK